MSHDEQRVHIHLHLDGPINVNLQGVGEGQVLRRLDRIDAHLQQLTQGVRIMAQEFDELTAEVERNTSVDDSIKTLVEGLAAQIEALKLNPAKLQELVNKLRSSSDSVAAKVLAHTPAAPA